MATAKTESSTLTRSNPAGFVPGVTNLALDVVDPEARLDGEGRPPEALAAIISMNVIHIAPWTVCEGIMRIAGLCLVNVAFAWWHCSYSSRDATMTSRSRSESNSQ